MDFLRDQERKALEREQKLQVDKKSLEERVKVLEEELQKNISMNKELLKKMRVMEYAMLSQKKMMRGSGNHQHLATLNTGGTIGVTQQPNPANSLNPNLLKGARHHRGNSDGI
jgi:hypothetical protein